MDPPKNICEDIATQSDLEGGWPQLRGVVRHPVITPKGRVISTPGYDRDTGLLVDITDDWPILKTPTKDDAVAAIERLKDCWGTTRGYPTLITLWRYRCSLPQSQGQRYPLHRCTASMLPRRGPGNPSSLTWRP